MQICTEGPKVRKNKYHILVEADQRHNFRCKGEKERLIKRWKEYTLFYPHPIFQKALLLFIKLWLPETGTLQLIETVFRLRGRVRCNVWDFRRSSFWRISRRNFWCLQHAIRMIWVSACLRWWPRYWARVTCVHLSLMITCMLLWCFTPHHLFAAFYLVSCALIN